MNSEEKKNDTLRGLYDILRYGITQNLFDKDKGYDCKCFLHIESSNFFKPNGFSTPGIHLCYRGTLKPSSEE